ncbi:MAG: hypothetical protein JWP74_3486 [Marmoricola sp.]|nr:hypothetical protein [Marmoricola sp.]
MPLAIAGAVFAISMVLLVVDHYLGKRLPEDHILRRATLYRQPESERAYLRQAAVGQRLMLGFGAALLLLGVAGDHNGDRVRIAVVGVCILLVLAIGIRWVIRIKRKQFKGLEP